MTSKSQGESKVDNGDKLHRREGGSPDMALNDRSVIKEVGC